MLITYIYNVYWFTFFVFFSSDKIQNKLENKKKVMIYNDDGDDKYNIIIIILLAYIVSYKYMSRKSVYNSMNRNYYSIGINSSSFVPFN